MKVSLSLGFLLIFICLFVSTADAQKRRIVPKTKSVTTVQTSKPTTNSAVVIDEKLAVLRVRPSLFAESVQRIRRGKKVQITGEKEADGVMFYRVTSERKLAGWIQSEAVFGKFRRGDDERLARLFQASKGFDQLEIGTMFFEMYPDSLLRPAILLLFGDLCEETAVGLSKSATRRLDRREMAATGAPLHSYYLNFVALDRYRKLGIVFFFNSSTKNYHYNGGVWEELIKKYPKSDEAAEARKRLDSLKEKLEKK